MSQNTPYPTSQYYRPSYGRITLIVFASLCATLSASPRWLVAQEFSEPFVARVQMRFTVGDQVVDEIAKGDLLTVLEEREDGYVVSTFSGKKGLVNKVDVLKVAEAVEIYDELIEANPKEGRLHTLRASAWWARGEEQKALADFDKAIEVGYREPHAYASRGLFHAALGNYEKALADYDMAIKQGADDASPYINRAAVFMTQQKFDQAVKDYTKAIEIEPKNSSIYQQRAVAWKLGEHFDKAATDFGKAIELDGKNVVAWMGRGFMWFQQQEYQKAVDDFDAAIKIAPNLAQAYNNRGYNRQMLGDHKPALADYDRAIELAPGYSLAYQNKAWLLASGDDPELRNGQAAIKAAATACKLTDYKDLGAVRALAAAFAEAGEFEKAIGWQEKVIELAPKGQQPEERETLEGFRAGRPFRLAEASK